jgi:AmpD protein
MPGDWLNGAERRPSPNHDRRPPGTVIDLLVIHNISLPPGQFDGPWIDDLFLNRLDPTAHPYFAQIAQLRVSAHLLIRRDGDLTQYVPLALRAWHAGRSRFQGRPDCNGYSIGIELEGSDDQSFEDAQYHRLTRVTREIMALYPAITKDRITGHSDIAPGRKTDPGPCFDWRRYLASL